MKKISIGTAIVLILAAALISALAVVYVEQGKINELRRQTAIYSADSGGDRLDEIGAKLAELDAVFTSNYVGEVDYDKVELGVLDGYLAGSGDRYAYYYTAEEFEEMMNESEGDSQGVGLSVIWNADERAIEILSIFPGGPADNSELRVGDLIVAVGIGENAEAVSGLGYEKALSMLRGKAGSTAEFTVLRGGEAIEVSIERGHYELQTVYSHMYGEDGEVGVIKITEFERVTPAQFEKAVDGLRESGANKFIVDLRNNPGGDRDAIIDVLDYILPEGPLFRLQEADGEVVVADRSDASCIDEEIVVITNGETASAAELFTAAMRDYDRALVVGTKTYGKGCMQTFFRLSDGSYFKTTSHLYYPPYSDNYDGVGIYPDVEVELDEKLQDVNPFKIEDKDDNQLIEAYKVLTVDGYAEAHAAERPAETTAETGEDMPD